MMDDKSDEDIVRELGVRDINAVIQYNQNK